jgi:hypothetical protein
MRYSGKLGAFGASDRVSPALSAQCDSTLHVHAAANGSATAAASSTVVPGSDILDV